MASDFYKLKSMIPQLPERSSEAAEILQRMLGRMPADDPNRQTGEAFLQDLRGGGRAPGLLEWLLALPVTPPVPPPPLPGAPLPRPWPGN